MSNFSGPYLATTVAVSIAVLTATTPARVDACGASFPNQLLDDRLATLSGLPDGNFHYEMSRIAQTVPGLAPVSAATINPNAHYYMDEGERSVSEQVRLRTEHEQKTLSSEHAAIVAAMRGMTDARAAEQTGASLPAELRWYTAGAVAFGQADYALAQDYFQRVLALPGAERAMRTTWAQYSLGRSLANQQNWEAARAAFTELRSSVVKGAADPLELAVASLGEEARTAMSTGDWGAVVRLYNSQLAHQSEAGYASLLRVADALLALPDSDLKQAMQADEVQQMLVAYLFSGIAFSGSARRVATIFSELDTPARPLLDRLAAVSYQHGDYLSAERFLVNAGDSGLAWWLRAKLALRAGDKQAAQAAYVRAAKTFPQDESWGSYETDSGDYEVINLKCRVNGESAILALERGDYADALDLLMQGAEFYWLDAAVVAERVLTIDELKGFVEQHIYPMLASSEPAGSHIWGPQDYNRLLRELLARRLLRANRYDEALGYFADPELLDVATRYASARKQAVARWTASGRAEAAFAAATLLHQSGMELIGYEMAPDYLSIDGLFEWTEAKEPDIWRNLAELQRQQDSAADPDKRFHYRYVAVNLASEAADQLSPRSQAFAATLCHATRWILYRDHNKAKQLYQRYVEHGPYVAWAENFGQHCQSPDFAAAQQQQWQDTLLATRLALRPYKLPVLAGIAGLALFAGFWLWRQRRTRV